MRIVLSGFGFLDTGSPSTATPRAALASARSRQGGFRFLRRLDDGSQERWQIVGLAAGDQVAVADHFGILILGAGIDDVVLDGEETGYFLALERLRRAEKCGTVADGSDHLALLGHLAGQLDDRFVTAEEIGREAA